MADRPKSFVRVPMRRGGFLYHWGLSRNERQHGEDRKSYSKRLADLILRPRQKLFAHK
jgi:hypothetical protein